MLAALSAEAVPIWFHWLIEYKQNAYMTNLVYVHTENPDMTLPLSSIGGTPLA